MLKVYSDGSGKDNKTDRSLTLAGFAGTEECWTPFERSWSDVLRDFPLAPSYMHMNEAFTNKGGFDSKNWTVDHAIKLSYQLNELVREMPRDHFCGFRYTVDLNAYRYWKPIIGLQSASRQAALDSFLQVYEWWARTCRNPILEKVDLFYDQNETFLKYVYNFWCNKPNRKKHPELYFINTVAPAEGRNTPPLQAADMLAWCARRKLAGPRHGQIDDLCDHVLSNDGVYHCDYNESYLHEKYSRIIPPGNCAMIKT